MRPGYLSLLLAVAAALVAPSALAYHGEDGTAGLVVTGPVTIDGAATLRATPGAALFAGPSDARVDVTRGVADVRVIEHRSPIGPGGDFVRAEPTRSEEHYRLPSPRITFTEQGSSFNLLAFTGGGVTAFTLDAPTGLRLEHAPAGQWAPTAAAASAGLNDATAPDAFRFALAESAVAARGQRGAVEATGDFSVFIFGANARFTMADHAFDERLGAWDEETALGPERVVRYAVIAFRGAHAAFPFTNGFAGFVADTVDVAFDGTARIAEARGQTTVGDRSPVARGGGVMLAGILDASLWPVRGDSASLRFEAQGDVTAMAVGAENASFLKEAPAAASLLVLAFGLLAYFWPALKHAVAAPLYARFNGDEVMDHGARETAFHYVRDHPGVSLNDVARGLDMAWSTAAYHLRVLEREGFITGERRGRHRRFFVAGAAQTKDAAFAVEHPTARRLVAAIQAEPGRAQQDLAKAAGVTPSTASWHLKRLVAQGFVAACRDWRIVRYTPGPRFDEVLGRLD